MQRGHLVLVLLLERGALIVGEAAGHRLRGGRLHGAELLHHLFASGDGGVGNGFGAAEAECDDTERGALPAHECSGIVGCGVVAGPRHAQAFVAINCAAIPDELIEAELFGHIKGAFTNAISDRKGRFELANGGTIFLDEIGDMSLKTQAKILRILQEKVFERVGDHKTISVDVRVIAATNRDLSQEIKLGRFREDLFYRLNVIPLNVRPLRERREDVPLLVKHFIEEMAQQGSGAPVISDEAMDALCNYSWPGNVRELKNTLERMAIMSSGLEIGLADMPPEILNSAGYESRKTQTLRDAKSDFERAFILGKLEEHDWNVSKTADALKIERSNLHRKLKSFDIDPKKIKGE